MSYLDILYTSDTNKDYGFIWAIINKMFVAEPDEVYKDVDLYRKQIRSLDADKIEDQVVLNLIAGTMDYYGKEYFIKKFDNLLPIYLKAIPLEEPFEIREEPMNNFPEYLNRNILF